MWFQQKIIQKNTNILRSSGIEVIEHLPYLDNLEFRKPEKNTHRMMVLTVLFQLQERRKALELQFIKNLTGMKYCLTLKINMDINVYKTHFRRYRRLKSYYLYFNQ